MKTIKVSAERLRQHLMKNQIKHIAEYKEAMSAYRISLANELAGLLDKAQNNLDIEHAIKTVRPINYSASYDEAIEKLLWTNEDIIELDQIEFKQYIQDEWAWSLNFLATTGMYKGKK